MFCGLVTLTVFMLIPTILNELWQQNGSVWRKMNYLAMPFVVGLMWYQILRNTKKNSHPGEKTTHK